MIIGDVIGVEEARKLLHVSRPTLEKLLNEYEITQFKIGRSKKFSKIEILQKIFTQTLLIEKKINFFLDDEYDFDQLKIDESSLDLRRVHLIDGHVAICLICYILNLKEKFGHVHLVIDNSLALLKAQNFFTCLKQYLNSTIFFDEKVFESIPNWDCSSLIKLPITRLGYTGAQTGIVDDLTIKLADQGYSIDVCSYIGWAIGELCDNAVTHAGVHPCFVQFTQIGDDRKFLLFTIGDVGIGIPESLRKNPDHRLLNDEQAVLTAFKPHISGRSNEERRGKGLTDVLKIAMECNSFIEVDSNGVGYKFKFNSGRDQFERCSKLDIKGTIVSILFIDGNFASYERDDVKKFIESCLESL